MRYRFVFIQCSYYRELFCSGIAKRLRNRHRHLWVRYIDTTKITVWCMSSLILNNDIQWFCYFIMYYFKLTNAAMVKRCMVKWCNGEINNSNGRFLSHKYWTCSFVLSSKHKVFVADKEIHHFQFLITNNKYRNQLYIIILRIKNKQTFIWYWND